MLPRRSSGTAQMGLASVNLRWWALALLFSLLAWIGLILASIALL
jgi:hypothetical protein